MPSLVRIAPTLTPSNPVSTKIPSPISIMMTLLFAFGNSFSDWFGSVPGKMIYDP
jgi:uncharacterized RDD family membrane protein YckC